MWCFLLISHQNLCSVITFIIFLLSTRNEFRKFGVKPYFKKRVGVAHSVKSLSGLVGLAVHPHPCSCTQGRPGALTDIAGKKACTVVRIFRAFSDYTFKDKIKNNKISQLPPRIFFYSRRFRNIRLFQGENDTKRT